MLENNTEAGIGTTAPGRASKEDLQIHVAQRVDVGIWYIPRAQRGSHIPTLRPKYIPYSYMDP